MRPSEDPDTGLQPADEVLEFGARRTGPRWSGPVAALLVGAVAITLLWSHAGSTGRSAASRSPAVPASTSPSSVTGRPVVSPSPPAAPRVVPARFPALPIRRAVEALCRGATGCGSGADTSGPRVLARRALGPLRDLQVRALGRGYVIAALRSDGAQLLAVVSDARIVVDPTRLGIVGPIGVQTQRNGRSRLVAIVSGALSAVDLLSRVKVQNWLATLTAPV